MIEKLLEGVKYDEGKLRFDLVPTKPLEELVRVYTIGAKKYEDRNWEKGIKFGRVFAALMRHAWAWWRGERLDPDNGQHHLAAVAWNAFALMEFEETHPELDDRPLRRPQSYRDPGDLQEVPPVPGTPDHEVGGTSSIRITLPQVPVRYNVPASGPDGTTASEVHPLSLYRTGLGLREGAGTVRKPSGTGGTVQ